VLQSSLAFALFFGLFAKVSLNPKNGEMLEPHLWTNQIEDLTKAKGSGSSRPMPLLFQYSLKQYARHRAEMLGSARRIAGDASADLMYRVAVSGSFCVRGGPRDFSLSTVAHFAFAAPSLPPQFKPS
jgi:hypothetical protein